MNSNVMSLLGIGLLLCTACNSGSKKETAVVSTDSSSSPSSTVIVEEVEKPTEPAKADPIQAIASKQISQGLLQISKAHVTGSILTIEMILDNTEKKIVDFNIPAEDIFYIDDATSKKISLLKDDSGRVMLSPTNSDGNRLRFTGTDNPVIINLKFPVPPADSKTISLSFGEFGSFDGMPITR